MHKKLAKDLIDVAKNCANEAELRLAWLPILEKYFDVRFEAERQHNDAYLQGVVIEFKDVGLFKGREDSSAFKEAVDIQLQKYILARAKSEGDEPENYIGIATDGLHIVFAHMKDGHIYYEHLLPVGPASISLLCQAIKERRRRALTPEHLIEDFGHVSDTGTTLMQALADVLAKELSKTKPNKVKMLFEEWRTLYGQVADLSVKQVRNIIGAVEFGMDGPKLGEAYVPAILFVIHTYHSLFIKLLGAEIIANLSNSTAYKGFSVAASSLKDLELKLRLFDEIERGQFFSRAGIHGFVEEAIFSWYLDACSTSSGGKAACEAIRRILIQLAMYRTDNLTTARSRDVLKHLYQDLVPEALRKSLGEFYTPDWLVEVVLDRADVENWIKHRFLDPTCGSASFLLAVAKRIREDAAKAGWQSEKILQHIIENVWGFDLNPLAVQAARVNFLIAIADLIADCPGQPIELPILLADAVYSPASRPDNPKGTVEYTIGSSIADLKIVLPSALALDRKRLDAVFVTMEELVEEGAEYAEVEAALMARKHITTKEAKKWAAPLSETYNRVLSLHRKNWNGIWFRIVRNFFWSATAGEFDRIVGNPPWVRWSKLPELYRERVKETCSQYDIFSSTPHHGGNELDISAMISYTVSDKWLADNGRLTFLVTQTLFQAPSSEGFRRFKINERYRLLPQFVEDLQALKPFPGAANRTAIFVAEKRVNGDPDYPLPYKVWKSAPGAVRSISPSASKKDVLSSVEVVNMEATPVGSLGSPWAVLPVGQFSSMENIAGTSDWVRGRKGVTVDLNGIYFVKILRTSTDGRLVEVETRPEAGRTNIGPKQKFWVEPDMLYPLLKGASDFSACHIHPKGEIYVFVPNAGITKEYYDAAKTRLTTKLPKTYSYFKSFKRLLEQRSTYKGRMPNAPFYTIYNVGEYTFAKWKVIWAEQKDFCAAVASSTTMPIRGEQVFIPDHKLFFVDFNDPNPAYFLCGLLNTKIVRQFVQSHVIKTQVGNIFKHVRLPKFNKKNSAHSKIVKLCKQAHSVQENNVIKILEQIDFLAAESL
jgi:hypothetical protein